MSLTVRTISFAEHRAYVASRPWVPLEQTPGWGRGFVTHRSESVGWFDGGILVGAGLLRYRGLPRLPMRSVGVFDSGPDIDWTGRRRPNLELEDWLAPFVEYARDRGVFTARINPIVSRQSWSGLGLAPAAGQTLQLHKPAPPEPEFVTGYDRLKRTGWRPMSARGPSYVIEVPLFQKSAARELREDVSTALLPGVKLRIGTPADIPAWRAAIVAAHSDANVPTSRELQQRYEALVSDDLARVTLVVAERSGAVVYGGLLAVVGERAWDLSIPVPPTEIARPEVQVVRDYLAHIADDAGARWLVVASTPRPSRREVPQLPAGWPPLRMRELMGTWQFPVRATWHTALAPVVDRLTL